MNTNTQFSPSPWEYMPSPRDTHFIVVDGMRNTVCKINTTVGNAVSFGYQEANARLISAAPELLEALKLIVMAAGYENGEASPKLNELSAPRSVFDAARKAIEKATHDHN